MNHWQNSCSLNLFLQVSQIANPFSALELPIKAKPLRADEMGKNGIDSRPQLCYNRRNHDLSAPLVEVSNVSLLRKNTCVIFDIRMKLLLKGGRPEGITESK